MSLRFTHQHLFALVSISFYTFGLCFGRILCLWITDGQVDKSEPRANNLHVFDRSEVE